MPLREPRLEQDRIEINNILGWSGVSMASICQFVRTIGEDEYKLINSTYVYNRGQVNLEDTDRRPRECWMISIWNKPVEDGADCLFQQPVPIKIRFPD
jgi:hypothetical protein